MTWAFPKNFNPEVGNGASYFKFEQGANKFRIMSQPVFGQEYWNSEKDENGNVVKGENGMPKRKVHRVALDAVIPVSELEVDQWGKPGKASQFLAAIVYNYSKGVFQVMSVVQKQINAGIKALVDNEDWGDPTTYDITVTKTGNGRETKYAIMPGVKKEMPENIVAEFKNCKIDLKESLGLNEKTSDLPF